MELRRPFAFWRVPPWPGNRENDPAADRPLILLYHSIEKLAVDPWGVRVKPRNFLEHMAVLGEHCHPMRLTELDAALQADRFKPRSVIVTFDDGYVDNFVHALPAMQRYRVPGTVFVSSSYVGSADEYWWDELERLTLQPGVLPRRVALTVAGKALEWSLEDDAEFTPMQALKRRRNRWFAYEAARTPRQRLFQELWAALRAAPNVIERERALDDLRRMAKPSVAPRATHRCCNADQVRQLHASGLIEIGAHTVHHPSLGHISREEQRQEIFESKRALETMLQVPVTSFSYPFGTRIDYSQVTIDLLKEAGFQRTCSNFPDPVTSSVDRFQLPRVVVQDWDGQRFLRELQAWFRRYSRASAG